MEFQLKPGDTVGGFRLASPLGSGGMGRVFLAFGPGDEAVAIKVIRAELSEQETFRLRFAREVAALELVTGPCTANLIAADLQAEPQWIAMEYVPGPTLQSSLAVNGPLEPEMARLLAWALAEALDEIHRAGVIHRDIKPSNIILGDEGPKLLDFGIAQTLDSDSLTQADQRPGSLAWMAPEQLSADPPGTYTDVHAWGAAVYAAVTGSPPFGEGPPDALAWRLANTEPNPEPLRQLAPALADSVLAALAADPARRPTVPELIAATRLADDPDLTVIGGQTDISTALAQLWRPPAPVPASSATGSSVHLRRERRRRRTLAVAGSVVGLLALLGIGVAIANTDAEPKAQPSPTPTVSQAPLDPTFAGCPGEGSYVGMVGPWNVCRYVAISDGFAQNVAKAVTGPGSYSEVYSVANGKSYYFQCAYVQGSQSALECGLPPTNILNDGRVVLVPLGEVPPAAAATAASPAAATP
ncbi:MAG: serine/threonine protein kinase [Actinobacteria bacterium]|nr:MAG: serine/threonine protein kinase [Actinomycetota bacterium]